MVVCVPNDLAALRRARWLAEMSEALDEAHALVWQCDQEGVAGIDLLELMESIESARAEVRSFRIGRVRERSAQDAPEWIKHSPWRPSGL